MIAHLNSTLNINFTSSVANIRVDFPIKITNFYKKLAKTILVKALNYIVDCHNVYLLKGKQIFLDINFVDDAYIAKINSSYRNKNYATNVISLAYFSKEEILSNKPNYLNQSIHIGEIFVSLETMKNEALMEKIELKDHFSRLILHGFLHLLGYDHEREEDAFTMFNLEEAILKELLLETSSIVKNYWR